MASYPKRRGAQSAPKKSNQVVWFGVLAIAIVAGGALLATLAKRAKEAEQAQVAEQQEAKQASQPFGGLAPETPPFQGGAALDPNRPFASLDMGAVGDAGAEEVGATWAAAVKLAEEGEALFQEALAAKGDGNTSLLNERGGAAKGKFDAALEMTAVLEEQLIAARGESDKTVRELKRARDGWFDRLRWLHKSTGR